MPQYKWRSGSRISGVAADVAMAELERIASEHDDELRPADVVQEAQPTNSVLHPAFEWNNRKAADEYRLSQARHIIRAVRVVHPDIKEDRPGFVYVPAVKFGDQGAYRTPEVLIQYEEEWSRATRQLQMYISHAQRAIADLERIARESEGEDRIADVTVAISALEVAKEAIAALRAA